MARQPVRRYRFIVFLTLLIPMLFSLTPPRVPAAPERGERGRSPVSVVTRERSVTEVDAGIYVIRHPDGADTNPQGNTTVVIGSRDVLVVDSGYLPSSARADIAQIRRWTKKPVRYLVNTHWHPDHVRGNAAYAAAFPGLAIIAHETTPELERGFDEPNLARYRSRVETLRRELSTGRAPDGKPLSDTDRTEAEADLARRLPVLREFQDYRPVYPSVIFADAMTLDLGGRTVQLRHPGRGHTVGDVIAWLPRERVLIAGDLVTYPVPYFFAGWPYDEIDTLERLAALNARVIVPGHGQVLHDRRYLDQTLELLRSVRAQVVAEVRKRGSLSAKLEDVRRAIDFGAAERRFAGSDSESVEFFRESMDGLVKTFFYQIAE
jgi:glyoxylase-like metal-dependent hydrolase (beta-lactamase superfamily II)